METWQHQEIVDSKNMGTGSGDLAGGHQYKEAHHWHLAFR